MTKSPWQGGVIIVDDGQCYICEARVSPERTLLIELEGLEPSPEQLATLRLACNILTEHFRFSSISFCDVLSPLASVILGETLCEHAKH